MPAPSASTRQTCRLMVSKRLSQISMSRVLRAGLTLASSPGPSLSGAVVAPAFWNSNLTASRAAFGAMSG